ncbi:hypothetical protein AVEN_166443-1 [Araneus ventricosus]|uniref:Uncharacterized protein n=1 Tax=Araneus ventricosus TaxID=182803 RepID=A0A4Y2EYV2_ARAVE|nr:hypothetical protein AVEN_166443-1 [Araneus ventricosus]
MGFIPGARLSLEMGVGKTRTKFTTQKCCMDNAPYHTKVENPTPTKYSTKKEMIDWLTKNSVPCNMKMQKVELYSLIDSNHLKKIAYKIDNIIKENGHKVLRLTIPLLLRSKHD